MAKDFVGTARLVYGVLVALHGMALDILETCVWDRSIPIKSEDILPLSQLQYQ
jgi:hypothetical protein